MRRVHWTFTDTDAIKLSTGNGQMTVEHFPGGFTLFVSALDIIEDTELYLEPMQKTPYFGTQIFLMGEAEMILPDGQKTVCDIGNIQILRTDTEGVRVQMKANQIVRHVGVSVPLDSLLNRSDVPPMAEGLPDAIFDQKDKFNGLYPAQASLAARRLAAELSRPTHGDLMSMLRRESAVIGFFTEALAAFSKPAEQVQSILLDWEVSAVEIVQKLIEHDPSGALSIKQLAGGVNVSEAHLDHLFREMLSKSVAEYQRHSRLQRAYKLLTETDLPVQEIAKQVGYGYLGNFTRAFSNQFGDTPSKTRRNAKQDT